MDGHHLASGCTQSPAQRLLNLPDPQHPGLQLLSVEAVQGSDGAHHQRVVLGCACDTQHGSDIRFLFCPSVDINPTAGGSTRRPPANGKYFRDPLPD